MQVLQDMFFGQGTHFPFQVVAVYAHALALHGIVFEEIPNIAAGAEGIADAGKTSRYRFAAVGALAVRVGAMLGVQVVVNAWVKARKPIYE